MFAENFPAFFDTNGFAIAATLDGEDVNGILDTTYTDALGNRVEGYAPTFLCATSDANVEHGAELVTDSGTFTVVGVEPDGTGTTLLRLQAE